MSAHAYTEDQLVEQPAIGLLAELGWRTVSASEEIFGCAEPSPVPSGHPLPLGEGRGEGRVALGRETKGEVVLTVRLRAALTKLNPTLPPEAIAAAVDELTRDRSTLLLEQANREVYGLLKQGILVSFADREAPAPSSPALLPEGEGRRNYGQRTERLRVVDWETPANNDFWWSASSALPANSTPAAPTSSASSTDCHWS